MTPYDDDNYTIRHGLNNPNNPVNRLPAARDTGYNAQFINHPPAVSSPTSTYRVLNLKPSNASAQTRADLGGGDVQSGEPLVMPWDYHEDPVAWLNRRAAEMYRREEA